MAESLRSRRKTLSIVGNERPGEMDAKGIGWLCSWLIYFTYGSEKKLSSELTRDDARDHSYSIAPGRPVRTVSPAMIRLVCCKAVCIILYGPDGMVVTEHKHVMRREGSQCHVPEGLSGSVRNTLRLSAPASRRSESCSSPPACQLTQPRNTLQLHHGNAQRSCKISASHSA